MDCQDLAMSRAKKYCLKRHQFDLDLMLKMRFVGFNLNRYKSLDERLRLNPFKNDSPTKNNEQHNTRESDASHDATSLAHVKIETKSHVT